MEKDQAVRNQKVMIRLASVLDLQKRYMQVSAHYEATKGAITPNDRTSFATYQAQKRLFEQVIDVLELPIEKV